MSAIKPVFLFAASWRTGSTLLQRYITSTGQVLVWGEGGGALDDLQQAWMGFSQMMGEPSLRYKDGWGSQGGLALKAFLEAPATHRPHQWIATMCPPLEHLQASLAECLTRIYEPTALALGYPRWGVKETRCGIKTARFLRTLFPEAKFVFLIREPMAMLLSIRRRNWIGRPASLSTLKFYCDHWRERAGEFRQVDFGLAVKYEDFIADESVRHRLLDYLEINAPPATDFIASSRIDWDSSNSGTLNLMERWLARHWLSEEMRHWGYR